MTVTLQDEIVRLEGDCRLEDADGLPLRRDEPGMPAAGDEWAVVEGGGEAVRFRPADGDAAGDGGTVTDLRGGRWRVEGELAVLEAEVEEGKLSSAAYPDPLARVWSALTAPHSGDFVVSLAPGFEVVDWGGVTHAGGGSHFFGEIAFLLLDAFAQCIAGKANHRDFRIAKFGGASLNYIIHRLGRILDERLLD